MRGVTLVHCAACRTLRLRLIQELPLAIAFGEGVVVACMDDVRGGGLSLHIGKPVMERVHRKFPFGLLNRVLHELGVRDG